MSKKSFIERLLSNMKYIYDNIGFVDYDQRQELMSFLNYFRDQIVLSKFDFHSK